MNWLEMTMEMLLHAVSDHTTWRRTVHHVANVRNSKGIDDDDEQLD